MIVEKILGRIEEFDLENIKLEPVLLPHFDLIKPHQKTKTSTGEEIAISLPRGEMLRKGAVLYADEERIIFVELAEEDVLEISPKGEEQWGRAAFNMGNMHQLCYFTKENILIPYDSVMESLIKNLDIPYQRKTIKLDGERPNVTVHTTGHGHSHENNSHGHKHDHSEGHSHG